MSNLDLVSSQPARYVAVCSGKGGVGKSTLALLLAAGFAEQGNRTLLIDVDLGIGDAATLVNSRIKHGFEELLTGRASLKEAVVKVAARLWLVGTMPGSYLRNDEISSLGIKECSEIDELFDMVVIDTPSSLDPLYIGLIGAADLAITGTTPGIPAIADSYTQGKKTVETGSRGRHGLVVNRVADEADGQQSGAWFAELARKFLAVETAPLATLPECAELAHTGDNQSLLESLSAGGEIGAAVTRLATQLQPQLTSRQAGVISLWSQLERLLLPTPARLRGSHRRVTLLSNSTV
jgi:flagellar biosynthesis protein FlhG